MKSNGPSRASQSGFTLIELIVVIAIISVLVALAAGAYFRIAAAQQRTRTETTIKKVASGLQAQWSAVVDDVKDEIRNGKVSNGLLTIAGNDRDRANALYMKMRLKQEFPMSFAEARNPGFASYGIKREAHLHADVSSVHDVVGTRAVGGLFVFGVDSISSGGRFQCR